MEIAVALLIGLSLFIALKGDDEKPDLNRVYGHTDEDLYKMMRRADRSKLNSPEYFPHIDEIRRIQLALYKHRNRGFKLEFCGNIWTNRSLAVQASWLDVPEDLEQIVKDIEQAEGFESLIKWTIIW